MLPNGALKINKKKASVDVVIGDIAVTGTTGDLPADGVVSVDWAAAGVERTSGNVILDGGPGVTIHIHGHRTFAPADIEGSVLGTALVAPTGDISTVHDNVQITFVTRSSRSASGDGQNERPRLIRCCAYSTGQPRSWGAGRARSKASMVSAVRLAKYQTMPSRRMLA